MKKVILIFIVILSFSSAYNVVFAQFSTSEEKSTSFFFDAVCFRNDNKSEFNKDGRVDIYTLVPYQILDFEKNEDIFGAKYELYFEVFDSTGDKIESEKVTRIITEKEYHTAIGGTGEFDKIRKHFYLNSGQYEIRINMIDLLSGNSYKKSRAITIVNFDKFRIAMSGLMLISSIEERGGRFVITPHISDNVGMLKDGLFIFFEVYNNRNFDSVDFVYEIFNSKDQLIKKSKKFRKDVKDETGRFYKKVRFPENTNQGIYKIRLLALKKKDSEEYTDDDYLAITERSLKYFRAISGYNMGDINLAIRYLRYVANQSDIDYIEAGLNQIDKQKRFEEFWKNLDPSPNTERNEAFDEYYARIDFANKNYKSYTEGWLTDMGRIYIILGQPAYVDKSDNYNGRTNYVKWTYLNNREFIFADDTGLGDYRLTRSYLINEKYRYK